MDMQAARQHFYAIIACVFYTGCLFIVQERGGSGLDLLSNVLWNIGVMAGVAVVFNIIRNENEDTATDLATTDASPLLPSNLASADPTLADPALLQHMPLITLPSLGQPSVTLPAASLPVTDVERGSKVPSQPLLQTPHHIQLSTSTSTHVMRVCSLWMYVEKNLMASFARLALRGVREIGLQVNNATARVDTKKPKAATDPSLAIALQCATLQQAAAGRAELFLAPTALTPSAGYQLYRTRTFKQFTPYPIPEH